MGESGHAMDLVRANAQLAQKLVGECAARGVHLATAESLTGGMLASALVGVSGASAVFCGGVVSYATELKHKILSVPEERLAKNGPVDGEVAIQMAQGAFALCTTDTHPIDLALATTGVAGPDPDPQTGLEAGTVYLGLASARRAHAQKLQLSGDRMQIRLQTVFYALTAALEELEFLTCEKAVDN